MQQAISRGSDGPSGGQPADPSGEEPAPPVISGPRDLLRMYGIDDVELRGLTDGLPVGDRERETLLKIMFRMDGWQMQDLERWARDPSELSGPVKDPQRDRGQLFLLSGRVTRVEHCRPSPKQIERFELPQYFRCELHLDNGQPAVVFAARVPGQWSAGEPMEERGGAFGLLLKSAERDPRRRVPVFVARRISWYPPTPLGKLGMDVGLLDEVVDRTGVARSRRLDQREVSRAGYEREAFYAMLDAVGRAKPGQLTREANRQLKLVEKEFKRTDEQGNRQFSVVPLFMQPQKQRGRLVELWGRARRVVRIDVEDPDIVARFGIDHYYEMSVFTDDSEGNPLIFCVRQLPEGMPTGDGPDYGEQVRMAGFFFKLWSYHISSSGEAGETGRDAFRQPAPLLIGRQGTWYPAEPTLSSPIAGAIGGGLFVLALLGVWLALWRSGRSDRRFHEQTLAKAHSIDPDVSLNEIGLGADGTPDLSTPGPSDEEHGVGTR